LAFSEFISTALLGAILCFMMSVFYQDVFLRYQIIQPSTTIIFNQAQHEHPFQRPPLLYVIYSWWWLTNKPKRWVKSCIR